MPEAVPADDLVCDPCSLQGWADYLFEYHVWHQGLGSVQSEGREEEVMVVFELRGCPPFRQICTDRIMEGNRLTASLRVGIPEVLPHE